MSARSSWALHLGPGVVDIFDGEVELIFVTIVGTAILGAPIGQDPIDMDLLLVEERDHPIIEDVGRSQRRAWQSPPGVGVSSITVC